MQNVALVVHDTLRKDAFEDHFGWLPGTRFENARSPSHWTAPVHASMFSGQYPSEIGVGRQSPSLEEPNTVLVELLNEGGYTTRAFSANAFLSRRYGYDRGFDHFECPRDMMPFNCDVTDFRSVSRKHSGALKYLKSFSKAVTDDSRIYPTLQYGLFSFLDSRDIGPSQEDAGAKEALQFIRESNFGNNEFLFMNLDEVHGPYDPPAEYDMTDFTDMPGLPATMSEEWINGQLATSAYEDCVHYASDIYEEMFEVLREDFDYIITLSDHGELFGEYGVYQHDYGLYPELTHVPLSIYSGSDERDCISKTVGLIDIFQTILSIADISYESRGQSLLNDVNSKPYLSEYHGIPIEYKYDKLCREYGEEAVAEYDAPLRAIATPDGRYGYETHKGFETEGDAAGDDLQTELETMVPDVGYLTGKSGRTETDETVLDHLEDLGYA